MRYDYFSDMETTLIKLLVSEYIPTHFEYERAEEISEVFRIHLTEKKDPPHYPKVLIIYEIRQEFRKGIKSSATKTYGN